MTSVEPFVRWVQEKPGYWRLWRRDVGRQMWFETVHVMASVEKPKGVPWSMMQAATPRRGTHEPEDA